MMFFFALGHITTRCGRLDVLDAYQGFQSAESRHHLIEQDEVEGLLAAKFNGIRAVAYRLHLVSFLFQKDDVCLEKFYLVVYPK